MRRRVLCQLRQAHKILQHSNTPTLRTCSLQSLVGLALLGLGLGLRLKTLLGLRLELRSKRSLGLLEPQIIGSLLTNPFQDLLPLQCLEGFGTTRPATGLSSS